MTVANSAWILREISEINFYCKMWAQWEAAPVHEVSPGMPSDEESYSQEKHPQGSDEIGTQMLSDAS